MSHKPVPIAVLISGNGSNLQAIIDAIDHGLPAKIVIVISNKEEAYGLKRAKKAGIPTEVISHKDYPNRDDYDEALKNCLEKYQPKLIILAGFMRILGKPFIDHFKDCILNIHPSLLPKYRGLHTHKQVIANSDKVHGVTVHVVTAELDAGPILAQVEIQVGPEDTEETLEQKIHAVEHELYPRVIGEWIKKHCAITEL